MTNEELSLRQKALALRCKESAQNCPPDFVENGLLEILGQLQEKARHDPKSFTNFFMTQDEYDFYLTAHEVVPNLLKYIERLKCLLCESNALVRHNSDRAELAIQYMGQVRHELEGKIDKLKNLPQGRG